MVDLRDYTRRKLNLLDRANIDLHLTDQDYRVLSYIASAVDQNTGQARRKQKVIAAALGKKGVRGVQKSIGRLAMRGYIQLDTKDGGTYVNAYRLILEEANAGSPFHPVKANGNSPFAEKRRTAGLRKANSNRQTGEPPFAHDPFISLEIPTTRAPAIAEALSALGGKLAQRLSPQVAYAWFNGAVVVDVLEETITMRFSTKFKASRVQNEYEPALLACCSALVPGIKFLRCITAAESAA